MRLEVDVPLHSKNNSNRISIDHLIINLKIVWIQFNLNNTIFNFSQNRDKNNTVILINFFRKENIMHKMDYFFISNCVLKMQKPKKNKTHHIKST